MAHEDKVRLTALQLIDTWPGEALQGRGIPTDGWDNTIDNFKTTVAGQVPATPVGTKISQYSDASYSKGLYTMAYLKYHTFEDSGVSVGDYTTAPGTGICAQYDASQAEDYQVDTSTVPYYVVSNDITDTVAAKQGITGPGFRIAFPAAEMTSDGSSAYTNGYGDSFGWFWVGGVCPVKDVTMFDDETGAGNGAELFCGSMVAGGSIIAGVSTASIYLESPDMSAITNADNSEGSNVPQIAGFLDTSAA